MNDKLIVTLRSAPSISFEITAKDVKRSCFGALRFYPGIPRTVTAGEFEQMKKQVKGIEKKFDVRPYVESKRLDKRGATESEITALSTSEGIDHLSFHRKIEVLGKRKKISGPTPKSKNRVEKPVIDYTPKAIVEKKNGKK